MAKYILIGAPFEVYDHPEFSGTAHMDRAFGDALDMPEELGRAAISAGAAILPEAEFAKLGFTAGELAKYPNARLQQQAPDEWKEKHFQARLALHRLRDEIATAPAPAAAPSSPFAPESAEVHV